jgi:hypothetical protein
VLDFCLSNDERIKSYMTANDWKDELYDANEQQWFVDRRKFDEKQIIREYENILEKKTLLFIRVLKSSEGPYVRLTNNNDVDGSADPVSDKSS